VTLGNHALNRIAPELGIKLTTHHGKPQRSGDRILFPMYHPAAGIYESKYKSMLMQDFVDMDRYLASLPT
jgi:uracil-DNA glycosylase